MAIDKTNTLTVFVKPGNLLMVGGMPASTLFRESPSWPNSVLVPVFR
jgi:hypothetical protein